MLSKITLAGMHNYSNGSIWDKLSLPDGVDKESFINECLRQGSEFCLLYPDLDFMKYQIEAFSKKWYHNFDRWAKAYQFEYEALYNVDVTTLHNENNITKDKDFKSHQSNAQSGGKDSSGNYKAAYDASTPQLTTSDSSSTSLSSSEYGSESSSYEHSNSMHYEEVKRGNQGTTMSQEMLLAEYNAWLFNLYEHMAEIFVSEFCICIYT